MLVNSMLSVAQDVAATALTLSVIVASLGAVRLVIHSVAYLLYRQRALMRLHDDD